MTLYDTINIIEQIALQQPNVRTAKEGNVFDHLNANPSVQYAAVVLTQGQHQQDEQFNHFRFSIFYVDRLESDLDSNRIQIQSTGKEVLNNIIRTLTAKFDAECDDITYQPFTQRFADECAGVFASVVIDVPVDYLCAEDYADSDWESGRVVIRNQIKSIDITTNGHYDVSYDQGYTGLENVAIQVNVPTGATINNQDKKVSLSLSTATISSSVTADAGYTGLGKVEIEADASSYGQSQYQSGHSAGYDEGYESGYTEGSASVHCNLQHKNVTVTGATMTISPDGGYDGMSGIDIDASDYALAKEQEGRQEAIDSLESKTITSNGTYSASTDSAIGWSSVTVNVPGDNCNLQSKSVTYTTNDTFQVSPDAGYDGMSALSVTVNVPTGATINNQDKTVDLDLTGATATTAVTFDEDYTGLGTVTVNADATDYGNARYAEGQASVALQEKSVTLRQGGVTSIVPDDGYRGMSSVSVNAPMQRYSKNIDSSDPDNWNVFPSSGNIGFDYIHLDIQNLRRQVTLEGIAQGQEQITRQIKDLEVSANGTYTANTEGDKYLNFTGNSIYDLETWNPTNSRICIATIRTYPDSEGIIISNHHNRWSSLDWDSTVYGINVSNSGTVVEFKDCGLYASGTITTGIWHTLEFSKDSSTNELIAKIDDVLLPTSGTFTSDYDGNFTIGNTAVNVDWLKTKYNFSTTSTTRWNRDLIAQNDDEYRGIIAVVNEDYRQVTPSNGNYAIYKDDAVYGWSSVTVNVPQTTGGTLQIQNGTSMGGSSFSAIPRVYDFSQVGNFDMMFSKADNLQSVSEGDIDTSSGIRFGGMFFSCTSLTSISGLDTSGATDIAGLICRCTSLTSLQELDASSLEVDTTLGLFWPDNSQYPNLTDVGGLKNLKISLEDHNWNLCPNLSLQSCLNILNGLYDFTGRGEQPGEGQGKLKVHPNFITLVGDDISIGTDKGWSITA